MKPIKGKMTVELTLEDANYVNELIERDKAKPMRSLYFPITEQTLDVCPMCEKVLNKAMPFCGTCGQRIDLDNYEL